MNFVAPILVSFMVLAFLVGCAKPPTEEPSAEAAKKAAAKAKAAATKEANFEVSGIHIAVVGAEGNIKNAKKNGATDEDLREAMNLLEAAKWMEGQAKDMLASGSVGSAANMARKAQEKGEAAGSLAFVAMLNAKKAKVEAKAKAAAKKTANYEFSAAGSSIRTAKNLIKKASKTPRAGTVEINDAKTQLVAAKMKHEMARLSIAAKNYKYATEDSLIAAELADKAVSSAFKAIAMSNRPRK